MFVSRVSGYGDFNRSSNTMLFALIPFPLFKHHRVSVSLFSLFFFLISQPSSFEILFFFRGNLFERRNMNASVRNVFNCQCGFLSAQTPRYRPHAECSGVSCRCFRKYTCAHLCTPRMALGRAKLSGKSFLNAQSLSKKFFQRTRDS